MIGLILLSYVLISIPAVQTSLKNRAEKELTSFLGGKVEISDAKIVPFNELRLEGVSIYDPQGQRCISVGRIGAGLNLFSLFFSDRIEINYAELISLNAQIKQGEENGPLNIDFIIKAFQRKEDNKPAARFNLMIRNVVLRKSRLSFDRTFIKEKNSDRLDFNHIEITNLRSDIALPVLKNDNFTIDVRRLAFDEKSGFNVGNMSFITSISPDLLTLKGFKCRIGDSRLSLADEEIKTDGFKNIGEAFRQGSHFLSLEAAPFVPSDFAAVLPELANLNDYCTLALSVSGNTEKFEIEQLRFSDRTSSADLDLMGHLGSNDNFKNIDFSLKTLDLSFSPDFTTKILSLFSNLPERIRKTVVALGNVKMAVKGNVDTSSSAADCIADLKTDIGNVSADAKINWKDKGILTSVFKIDASDISLKTLAENDKVGFISAKADGSFQLRGKEINGKIDVEIPYVDFNNSRLENISAFIEKHDKNIECELISDNKWMDFSGKGTFFLDGENSRWLVDADLRSLRPSFLVGKNNFPEVFGCDIKADISGNSPDNLSGNLDLGNIDIKGNKALRLNALSIDLVNEDDFRTAAINSDFLNGEIKGSFVPTEIIGMVQGLLSQSIPALIKPCEIKDCQAQYADLNFSFDPDDNLVKSLGLPFKPAVPIVLNGKISGEDRCLSLNLDAPYLIKGKNKLIKSSGLSVSLKDEQPAKILFTTTMPVKNIWAQLGLSIEALNNHINTVLSWQQENKEDNQGKMVIDVGLVKNPLDGQLEINADVERSSFNLGGSEWQILPASIFYSSKLLRVQDFRISTDTQFIKINGKASDNPIDVLNVDLAGIDLEYIFELLNINYVDFGGIATGEAHVSSLFSKSPVAATDKLFVRDLSYNGCVLGNGELEGRWDNKEQKVAIYGDIRSGDKSRAIVDGGVYVTRDSLSFDFKADKVNVEFLRPFVSGFTSSITGKASGHVKMYGTFKDIDLVGAAVADSVTLLVDYTNVYYSGSDSVIFTPGKISIPHMEIHDRYGKTCDLRGEVTHNFLHDASFEFDVDNVKDLLVYDTNPSLNPQWYGHVFANGSGIIRGVPGRVDLNMNMTVADNSAFTLVLDENETAVNYSFLTFSDRQKELIESLHVEETFEESFLKNQKKEELEVPTSFFMDLALEVTPGAEMVIVMDPKAGDKISARGSGPLQFHYDTDLDKFTIYGKYTLSSGTYNFSLQDLILKNFNIKEGSAISFNGDPLRGLLDITAAYRVNANLTDLDDSFRNDPDLNRTSVPVDALLKITGEIDSPEINFDIELPTVTSDVERRVRSIVSTEDMMNQQMIYLLALNRFYSPDYTSSSQGGELATVASSTISSQIQNIIGSMTDKFSLAPSFKSDKDNFSELEVDVALSSSLFDNRLLINGNLGYRDKNTSNTNFIGDFDIEYLLTRDGKLRLKAYNHFNDASYYLRSALTTQGLGIVYRRDFDKPFTFIKDLFRRKNKNNNDSTVKEN